MNQDEYSHEENREGEIAGCLHDAARAINRDWTVPVQLLLVIVFKAHAAPDCTGDGP